MDEPNLSFLDANVEEPREIPEPSLDFLGGTLPSKSPTKIDTKQAEEIMNTPEVSGWLQEQYGLLTEAVGAGWERSITGMMYRGKAPESNKPLSFLQEAVASGVEFIDLPYYLAGFALGGGPTPTGFGGAMALPAAVRKVYMDHLEKGEISSVEEFSDRMSGALVEAGKGYVSGLVTGQAGTVAQQLGGMALRVPAEITASVAAQSALENRLPSAEDFKKAAAASAGGVFIDHALSQPNKVIERNMMARYKETGEPPQSQWSEIQTDVPKRQDVFSENPLHLKLDTKAARKSFKERVKSMKEGVVDYMIDDLDPIRRMMKEVGDSPDDMGPYITARMFRGWHGKFKHFMDYGALNFKTGESVSRGMRQILGDVDDMNSFRTYSVLRRAKELEGRGLKTGLEIVKDKDMMISDIEAKYPKYAELQKELVDFQSASLRQLKDSGVLSDKAYKKMLENGKEYIPFERNVSKEDTAGGLGVNPIHKLEGSDLQIVDPLITAMKNTAKQVQLSELNHVNDTVLNYAEKNGYAKPYKPADKKPPTIQEVMEYSPEQLERFFDDGTDSGVMPVYRNGRLTYYEVDAGIHKALSGLTKQQLKIADGIVGNILKKPAAALRAGATLTPEFVGRNVMRDSYAAVLWSKAGLNPFDVAKGFASAIKRDKAYQRWLASGGGNVELVSVDRSYMNEKHFKEIQSMDVPNKIEATPKALQQLLTRIAHPINTIRTVSEISEQGVRIAEFEKARSKGASMTEAGFRSRDISIDFQKAGIAGRELNKLVSFLNAGIQGNIKTLKELKNPKTAMKVMAYMTLPSIALEMYQADDPDYQNVPDWQKDAFWCFKADGIMWRIPKPHLLGMVGASIPQRFVRYMYNNDKEGFRNLQKSLSQTLIPDFIPTAVKPALEVGYNYDSFRDTQLIPAHLEGLLPEYQYVDTTSEFTKGISKALGQLNIKMSPIEIRHLALGYTGGLGRYGIELMDKAGRELGVLDDPVKAEKQLADMPVIRGFTIRHPSSSMQPIKTFREEYDKFAKYRKTASKLESELRYKEAISLYGESDLGTLESFKEGVTECFRRIHMYNNLTPEQTNLDEDTLSKWKRQVIEIEYNNMLKFSEEGLKVVRTLRKRGK